MKYINLIIIIYNCINLINTLNNSNPKIAVFPFKTFQYPHKFSDEQFSSKEYMDIIHSSLIYLNIEIGKDIKKEKLTKEISSNIINNKQFLTLFIDFDNYDFYIDDKYFYDENKKKICHYSTHLSTSYEIDKNDNSNNNMKDAIIATDYINVYDDKNINININNNYQKMKIFFRHSYKNKSELSFACGNVGLLFPSNKFFMGTKTNFINQIHDCFKNIDFSFSIEYNAKENLEEMNEGILIIGEESIKKNQNIELISIYAKHNSYSSGKLEWEFDINQISVGNKIIENEELTSNFDILIKSHIDGIQIPYFFYQEINSIFFKNYHSKKICQYELVNNLFIIISCNSDKFNNDDIASFPQINFLNYKIGFNFTFTGMELFVKKGNKYFFKMVTYSQRHFKSFYFGRIFLKKYKVIFNSDSKLMYFFNDNKNLNIMKNDIIDNKRKITLISLSYVFMSIIFLVVGIFLGRKYCFKKRKLYANELEDDNYIYESKQKRKDNEKKLIYL